MTLRRFLFFTLLLSVPPGLPSEIRGQDHQTSPKSFERKYIDASAYRQDQVQLYDWPDLTELVVWSRHLESAIAQSEESLAGELIEEFEVRLDSLQARPLPGFLAGRADSVKAALDAVDSALERAQASIATLPEARVTPQPGKVSADAQRQRTVVTGSTAVTVPAGVAVGKGDSLPSVAFEAGDSLNFVDLVVLALHELDRVVHLTRTAGAEARAPLNESPSAPTATPARDTPPPRPRP